MVLGSFVHTIILQSNTNNDQPEFAHPYEVLAPHTQITIASPAGGEAPLDPSSVEAFKEDAVSSKFLKNNEALWKNTQKVDSFLGHAKEYEAIFFVGGHGRMFFFP
jgi:putative intracellular protease/amidase